MNAEAPAFSKVVMLSDLPPAGFSARIEADDVERDAIAERLAIPEVKRLSGDFVLQRTTDGLALQGRIEANLIRICVASLETMDEAIAENFEIRFARSNPGEDSEVELDEDTPEPLPSDAIDLAEILVQQLALAMDPYPRKDGARPLVEEHGATGGSTSPFAALKGAFAARGDKE